MLKVNDFYPRPPRGGRQGVLTKVGSWIEFLSTPSARRATVGITVPVDDESEFLSTPSARRATRRSSA